MSASYCERSNKWLLPTGARVHPCAARDRYRDRWAWSSAPRERPQQNHGVRQPPAIATRKVDVSTWHSISGAPIVGSAGLVARAKWAIEVFEQLGVTVNQSGRLPSAIRLLDSINDKPSLMLAASTEFLYAVGEADRTIWEFFIIAYVADMRGRRKGTPFTPSMLTTALAGAQTEISDKHPKPRSTQFELYVAALLSLGGADVQLEEPDLRMLYWGDRVGVAIKRMRSNAPEALEARLLEAAKQIAKRSRQGFIAINVDVLFSEKVLPGDELVRNQEFNGVMAAIDAILDRRFNTLKHVRGLLIFGRLEVWDLEASPPRHDTALPMSQRLFDDEEDRTQIVRDNEFWTRHTATMDRELLYLRTGKR